jgi:hypothetical protein
MRGSYKSFFFFILLIAFTGCQKQPKKAQGVHIFRNQEENFLTLPPPQPLSPSPYPWSVNEAPLAPITKEFFRCKGSQRVREVEREGRCSLKLNDCQGGWVHSLPLKEGREYIYPPLISILNFIQQETQKKVVVTTGHRCPEHHRFSDASSYNWNSKHMIGAEVDFYVQGMEHTPSKIIELIQRYYHGYPEPFRKFKRFGAEKLNVSTDGWYNEEIFIKLYRENEGRDQDNLHPYPYLSIQIRTFEGEKVSFDEKMAKNYLRD